MYKREREACGVFLKRDHALGAWFFTGADALLALFLCAAFAAGEPDSLSRSLADTISKSAPAARWDSAASLDKMVVTGTRTQRSIKDNPGTVFVVSREQIASSPANNVSDILLYQPGLIVQRSVGMGEGVPTNINLRGVPPATAASRTLILVDGIPTNAVGTPFLILNEIPMESIDRVEIVEGPYSGLYGPNALGGVVNIITRNPAPGWHGAVSGGGFPGFYDVDGEGSMSLGRFSLLVNAAARGIDNWTGSDTVHHTAYNIDRTTNSDNYGYYDRRFFGKLGCALSSRATLTLQARYFDSNLGFGYTEYGTPPSKISIGGQKFLVGPSLKVNVTPSLDLKVAGYFGTVSGTFSSQRSGADTSTISAGSIWKSLSNDIDLDAQATMKLGNHNTLTAGFDLLDNIINFGALRDPATGEILPDPTDSTKLADSTNKSMINGGIYAQDEMRLGRFIGIAGARLDYNSAFGAAVCPKLGIVYKQNDMLRFKLSAGRAFRAPSLGELYMPDLPINSSSTLVSNPTLVPEYILTVDGGPELEVLKLMSIRLSGFYNYMNDLITQRVITTYLEDLLSNAQLSHKNIENAWSAGAEACVEMHVTRWGMFFFNYTYTRSENEQIHGALDYIPEHAFNTGIYFARSFGPITVSGSILEDFVGDRDYLDWQKGVLDTTRPLPAKLQDLSPEYVTLPSYFRTDASVKVAWRMVWGEVQGLNLFNAHIVEEANTVAPPRFVEAKVGVKF
jgi:outer membrane cobalamin receptor